MLAFILSLALQNAVFAQTSVSQTPETTVTQIQNSDTRKQPDGKKVPAKLMSEPEALAIAKLVQEIEVQSGELAQEKAKEAIVKTHGQQSKQDHQGLKQAIENFEKKADVTPQASPLSRNLEVKWKAQLAELEAIEDGKQFDRAYINQQIQFHQEALKLMGSTVKPNAKSRELKEIAAKTEVSMKGHLEHALYTKKTFSNEGLRY